MDKPVCGLCGYDAWRMMALKFGPTVYRTVCARCGTPQDQSESDGGLSPLPASGGDGVAGPASTAPAALSICEDA